MERNQSVQLTRGELERFRAFLDQQEAKLGNSLLMSTLPPPGHMGTIHLHGSGHFRLTQALQVLSGRVHDLREDQTEVGEWKTAVEIVNKALWDFLTVLEGAVSELITHVEGAGMGSWNEEMYEVSQAFKELLAHRIEDTIWIYRRLEELFFAYRATCKKHKNLWVIFGKFLSPFSTILDKEILNHLFKAEELLSTQFKRFSVSYELYRSFQRKAEELEVKFRSFEVFNELSHAQQEQFLKLYRLICIWEENSRHEALLPQDLLAAIRGLAKPGIYSLLFRDYYRALKTALFDCSLSWQKSWDSGLKVRTDGIKRELQTLGTIITRYRENLLRSDPNPYVRTKWGVSEWAVGPEPRRTRELMQMIFDVEMVMRWCDHLTAAMSKATIGRQSIQRQLLMKKMDELLHEMGQPLSSRTVMHAKADQLIGYFEQADELGGSLGEVHGELTDYYLKALRQDCKYQVLFDFPKFQELYAIHEGFLPAFHDPMHAERMKLFKGSLHHIEHWLKEHDIQHHERELEFDEGAIQESLQQLFAAIQRGDLPKGGGLSDYFRMLLEYRYLFSKFFYFLRGYEAEGKWIRKQFLFVDYYLEASEKELRREPHFDELFNYGYES